jgi:UDP-N-acetylmuramyl tripeptide synthase
VGGGSLPLVVIDYAHTPDALEKALEALRPAVAAGHRLFCVFGCGGDRDPGKRPLMGATAARLADRVVVTSDNPRSEAPGAIIAQVLEGIPGEAEAIEDRQVAIFSAVHHARPGDVVLLAGKGHETYQEIAGMRHPFDDRDVARAALADWNGASR